LRSSWHFHLRRGRWGQRESLAFHFVAFDHRLPQILHMHGRSLSRSCGRLRRTGNGRSRSRCRHGNDRCLLLRMIQQDGLLRSGIGDDAAGRRVEAKFAVARPPHARSRLRGSSSAGRLSLGGAVRTRGWRRRRCWNMAHGGEQFSTHRRTQSCRNQGEAASPKRRALNTGNEPKSPFLFPARGRQDLGWIRRETRFRRDRRHDSERWQKLGSAWLRATEETRPRSASLWAGWPW
jgi:hypothetical protein